MAHILIVDDEEGFTAGISEFLRLQDHTVATANSIAGAREAIENRAADVILLDLMLPDGNGLQLLDAFEEKRPQKIIFVTGHSGVKSLIGDMAGEGVMYMKKPIEPRELVGIINTLVNTPDTDDTSDTHSAVSHFGLLVGESKPMQKIYDLIEQVAATDSTVFVQGESGTGKELVAEAIHRLSHRHGQFVPVNCGGLSKDLVGSQLFGHEKGGFTGASRRHEGFFERADKGTLFLDEITEMPLDIQTHLLRALESGRVLRIGSEQEISVDARLIAATNRDAAQAVRKNLLREDLYFRLHVFPIVLPPLRERADDISVLADYFLEKLNAKHNTRKQLDTEAEGQLRQHSWPGNVRELKHAIHRAYILSDSNLVHIPEQIDDELRGEIEGLRPGRAIADVEKDLIESTLEHFSGDKKAAALSLGISLKTLYNRLKEYGDDQAD